MKKNKKFLYRSPLVSLPVLPLLTLALRIFCCCLQRCTQLQCEEEGKFEFGGLEIQYIFAFFSYHQLCLYRKGQR